MKASDFKSIFDPLKPSIDKNEYTMKHVINNFYLGKTYANQHCLLLSYPRESFLQAGRVTKGISLKYFSSEDFLINGDKTENAWAVITCLDPILNSLFTVLAEGIKDRSNNNLMNSPRDILEYIMDWQELLASVPSLTEKQLQGLWGELYFILHTNSPEKAITVWEGPNKKKFDFSNNGIDIEVKTSLNRHIHTFSDEQLQVKSTLLKRYIYSLYLDEDITGGKSTSDLVNEIRNILPRVELFEKKLLLSGYKEDSFQDQKKFSIQSSKLVAISNVPKVRQKDIGVFNLKYQSDLTFCTEESNKNEIYLQLLWV
ncbi:PD-(D/E)XK motif protein [Niallia taxi]|nr:PD-(D/E)XK motif protein [Niallia taxi]MDE5052471.1 PD-(D/E)XK motif protein [Niallia taxi]